ncbi:hypothetical protein PCANC_00085 [Puccinia coronata f. sp. avenae]|uniref:Uncharacterized protein n=1 Tax=Puccinia coronata f. sp. avenae TaxID=200324 RepID=A0A2N5W8D5_9BASI|nr:hypothetical protein PCANC_00085 [Puccinia coronata f. sp. avenae]
MDVTAWEKELPRPEKLAWMATSKLILDAAIRFKLGRCATNLNRMAVSAINSDAAIQASFAGSVQEAELYKEYKDVIAGFKIGFDQGIPPYQLPGGAKYFTPDNHQSATNIVELLWGE